MENKVAYYQLDNHAILFLGQQKCVVPIAGKAALNVLKGDVEVMGYRLPHNQKLRCESAKDRPQIIISAVPTVTPTYVSSKYIKKLFAKLKIAADVPFPVSLVFLLRNYTQPAPTVLPTSGSSYTFFSSWRSHIASIVDSPKRVLVTGSKNTGKSAFAVYLINACMTKGAEVFTIDTDLGKPLFTIEGCVSLCKVVAPVLTNRPKRQQVIKSLMINETTPKDKPMLYLKSVAELIRTYDDEIMKTESSFLIVNTHGWTEGLGNSLLEQITILAKPDVVISLETGDMNDRSEYEWGLYNGTLGGVGEGTKVLHIVQPDIKSYLKSTGKYKAKNIEEIYKISCGSHGAARFVPFSALRLLVPRSTMEALGKTVSKYDLLKVFNAQYVAVVAVHDKSPAGEELRVDDVTLGVWSEEDMLGVEGVGFVANIDYAKGVYLDMKEFAEPGADSDLKARTYRLLPLHESIHPRWGADDPVEYLGQSYYYDSYSELSYMPNKRQLTK